MKLEVNLSEYVQDLNDFEKRNNSDVNQIELKNYDYGCWKNPRFTFDKHGGYFEAEFDNGFKYVPRPWIKEYKGVPTYIAVPRGKTEVTPPPLVKLWGKPVTPFNSNSTVFRHKIYVKNGKYVVDKKPFDIYNIQPSTINVGLSNKKNKIRFPAWVSEGTANSEYAAKRIQLDGNGVSIDKVYKNYKEHNNEFYYVVKNIVEKGLIGVLK